MKLGIKIGLKNDSLKDLEATSASLCEVWYNAGRPEAYYDLFSQLQKNTHLDVGLHYWGALPDGTLTSIAYPDTQLIRQSLLLMRQTIDTAAHFGFVYVNIHPTNYAKVKVDFETMTYPDISDPCPLEIAQQNFLENVQTLNAYAKKHGVVLTVETVSHRSPGKDWFNPLSRLDPVNLYDQPLESLYKAKDAGIWVANDFVHTATHIQTDDPNLVFSFLYEHTQRLAPRTRLLHMGFLVPPYNGVDNHDMFDNPLLDTSGAVPNKQQLKQLMQLFQNRPDIWIITEPRSDHVQNYFWVKNLLIQANVGDIQ